MSEQINISKIKIRRGLNSERLQIILDNGELGFTTDTQRLFVGDGVTEGGIPASNKFAGSYTTVTNIVNIEEGDYVLISNALYIFNGGDKNNIANYLSLSNVGVDNITIAYNGSGQLYVKSIKSLLASSIDTSKGVYVTPASLLGVNVDGTSITTDATTGKLKVSNIDGSQHGNLGGGSLHATATTSIPGFMSSSDKTKLNNSPDWSTTPLTNSQTQLIIDSINQYGGGGVSNVATVSSVDISLNNTSLTDVPTNFLLNQQNSYNETVQPGNIFYSAADSAKVSNVGELAQWTIDAGSIASFDDAGFVLTGGDGYMYGFTYNPITLSASFNYNIQWTTIEAQTKDSLMSAISSIQSNTPTYSYRVFDVYNTTSTAFVVKSLFPNYCTYFNNINGTSNITITQNNNGKQSASLSKKLTCNPTVSNVVPVSGNPTTITLNIVSSVNGSAIDANNSNRALTIYNSDYSKNVFYFYNTSTLTPTPPSINLNKHLPGTVTNFYTVPYITSDPKDTIIDSLTAILNLANFEIISKTGDNVVIKTQTPGYCLDVYSNYDTSAIINTVGRGGGGSTDADLFDIDNPANGVPALYSLIPTCSDIITSVGSPGIQNILLPGIPSVTFTTQSSTRNSVALIKY